MFNDKPMILVARAEEDQLGRKLAAWINTCPDLPDDLYKGLVQYEQLPADQICMAISTIQSTYITKQYITGGHQAEYQFKLIYRIQPGTSNDKRLGADELLDRIGSWAMNNKPDLGAHITSAKVVQTTRSAVFAAYNNGDEDHQVLMNLTYEVI